MNFVRLTWQLNLRRLFDSPLRLLLTVFGIAIGVASMMSTFSLNRTVIDAFSQTLNAAAGKADLSVYNGGAGVDEGLLDAAKSHPLVADAAPSLTSVVSTEGPDAQRFMLLGFDLLSSTKLHSLQGNDIQTDALGDDFEFINSDNRILLSAKLANAIHKKSGDTLRVVTPSGNKELIVHGILKDTDAMTAFGGASAVMDIQAAQLILNRPGKYERIDLLLKPEATVESAQPILQALFAGQAQVAAPNSRGDNTRTMLETFQMSLNLGAGIALIVGLFLIYNTIALSVVQRERDIGILKAIGATTRQIMAWFIVEALLLSCIGIAIGIVLARIAVHYAEGGILSIISSIYVQVNSGTSGIQKPELVMGSTLTILGTAVAAWIPSLRIARVEPVLAMRRERKLESNEKPSLQKALIASAACTLCTVLLLNAPAISPRLPLNAYFSLLFGLCVPLALIPPILYHFGEWLGARVPAKAIELKLALGNIARQPLRSAIPASALALGLTMTVAIGGFLAGFEQKATQWIRSALPADFLIVNGADLAGVQDIAFNPEAMATVKKVEGVRDVNNVRVMFHDFLGMRGLIIAHQWNIYRTYGTPLIVDGDPKMRRDSGLDRAVVISENLAIKRNLGPGKSVTLDTPMGPHTYNITAVTVDYTSDQGSIIMDRSDFDRDFKDSAIDSLHVLLQPGADKAKVRQGLEDALLGNYDARVRSNEEIREKAVALIHRAFSATYIMEALAFLLAIMGVTNTLLASVVERTRDLGVQRALGSSKASLTVQYIYEALVLGLVGWAAGTATGLALEVIVVKYITRGTSGWVFPWTVPWPLLAQTLVLSLICAGFAAIFPARRAAAMPLREALAYEA